MGCDCQLLIKENDDDDDDDDDDEIGQGLYCKLYVTCFSYCPL